MSYIRAQYQGIFEDTNTQRLNISLLGLPHVNYEYPPEGELEHFFETLPLVSTTAEGTDAWRFRVSMGGPSDRFINVRGSCDNYPPAHAQNNFNQFVLRVVIGDEDKQEIYYFQISPTLDGVLLASVNFDRGGQSLGMQLGYEPMAAPILDCLIIAFDQELENPPTPLPAVYRGKPTGYLAFTPNRDARRAKATADGIGYVKGVTDPEFVVTGNSSDGWGEIEYRNPRWDNASAIGAARDGSQAVGSLARTPDAGFTAFGLVDEDPTEDYNHVLTVSFNAPPVDISDTIYELNTPALQIAWPELPEYRPSAVLTLNKLGVRKPPADVDIADWSVEFTGALAGSSAAGYTTIAISSSPGNFDNGRPNVVISASLEENGAEFPVGVATADLLDQPFVLEDPAKYLIWNVYYLDGQHLQTRLVTRIADPVTDDRDYDPVTGEQEDSATKTLITQQAGATGNAGTYFYGSTR